MTRTVQLSIADAVYATALRDALVHSGPWNVTAVDRPDPVPAGVLVVDEPAFSLLHLPLANPERVVLIIRPYSQLMAQVWDAGIVSVVSSEDSPTTVLLAIMAAALRIANAHGAVRPSGISPNPIGAPACHTKVVAQFPKSPSPRKPTRREIKAES
jgi:hypothetical protein